MNAPEKVFLPDHSACALVERDKDQPAGARYVEEAFAQAGIPGSSSTS